MPKAKPGESHTGKNRISKSTTTDGSEQSSTTMEEKRNNRQSDSSANQSEITGDISSNNDDKTKDDNSGGDVSSNNDDETTSDNTLQSNWSIYKLANNRLAGVEKIKYDIKEFEKCIKEKLLEKGMQHKGDNGDKCEPYHLMHFFYCTKAKNNVTAVQIGEQLAYPVEIGDCPGDRRSGNILVFYRLKENVPEAFFLCKGFGFHCILYLSDPLFRTRVAKRFMDGEKIKEIETFSIAGSDIDSKIIYQDFCNIAAVSFLERAIVKLTGRIIENSDLDNAIQRNGSEAILMTVGINFVRIGKPLEWKEWTKVLTLFSNEEMEVEGQNCYIEEALEYVRRVEDNKSCELDRTITEKVIDIIANNTLTSSYYLSHRYVRDWSLSSNVILKEQQTTPILCKEITSWHSAPTLSMVIEAISRHFTQSPQSIRKQLTDRNIMLSYDSETGMKNIPVQDYVHGCVSQDGDLYYKIAQKWFFLSSTYSQVVDRTFADMTQCMQVEQCIPDLKKYPWRHDKLEITISDFHKILGVSTDEAEIILQKLTQGCKLVDEHNHCCLTEHSYLLPQSSELYKELAKKGNTVGKMLYHVLTAKDKTINDNGVLSVLKKDRKIVVKEADKYFVCNPILTEDIMKQINSNVPSLEESRLSNFLRCMIPLSEGDYNALYLNYEEDTNLIIFPGDKVLANNVELFDVLVYDKKNHTTYLFHNKVGLDNLTRDACAQIRNASELLWYDFVSGGKSHIKLFWESAVESKTTKTPYRYFLQRKLQKLGKNTFEKMFNDDAKIVFVLGFVIFQSKASPKLHWELTSFTLNDFEKGGLTEDDKKWLEGENILTISGYLTDRFIGMTQNKFVENFKSSNRTIVKRKQICKFLATKGTCNLSTIAKLELLTLGNCFSRYQIGGKRHYHLQLLQFDSK